MVLLVFNILLVQNLAGPNIQTSILQNMGYHFYKQIQHKIFTYLNELNTVIQGYNLLYVNGLLTLFKKLF